MGGGGSPVDGMIGNDRKVEDVEADAQSSQMHRAIWAS